MKNLILKSFLAISILTSVILLVLKFTGHLDISLFNAVSFAFIPNLTALIINISKMLFNRFEAFINTVLNILMF
jgi:galactitol-specific phosphotransferase system IIC component